MAENNKLSLDRIISIAAFILAIATAGYSGLHSQNKLEYLTKEDFNTFQIDNIKKMTSLEGTVQSGFNRVSQQLSTLNFVATKDFQEFKDKTTSGVFELQKAIDFLRKDLDALQKDNVANASKIQMVQERLAVLEAFKKQQSE